MPKRRVNAAATAEQLVRNVDGPLPNDPADPARSVEHTRRAVVLLGVEQLLEHSPELMMSPLAESPGDLILEVFDGGPTSFDAGFALPSQHDELGAPVTRVGSPYDVAQGLELVGKLAHGLQQEGIRETPGAVRSGHEHWERPSG